MKIVVFIILINIQLCSLLFEADQLKDFPNSIFESKNVKSKNSKQNRKLNQDMADVLHGNSADINKIFNIQQTEQIGKDLKCNENALKAFGLIGETDKAIPMISEGSMRKYCRKNRFTCCNTKQIEQASKQFIEFKEEFLKSFNIVEQMLYIFRGGKVFNFLNNINDTHLKNKCQDIILGNYYYGELNQFEDFLYKTYPQQISKIESLLEDTILYVKKNIWFYSNINCAVCSPFLNSEFQMNPSGASVNLNNSTCQEIVDLHEYEYRLVIVYESFIKQIVSLVDCVHQQEQGTSIIEEFKIENLDLQVAEMVSQRDDFYSCFQNFIPTEPACLDICQKQKLVDYQFPVPIFEIFKNANKVLFSEFVNEDLEEYYEKVMGYDINKCCTDEPIQVFTETESFKTFKLDAIDLKFSGVDGIRLFNEQMGKAFQYPVSKNFKILNITFLLLGSFIF